MAGIGFDEARQMRAFVADITDVEQISAREDMLDREVPVLRVRRQHAGLDGEHSGGTHELLGNEGRCVAVVGIRRSSMPGPGKLIRLGPGKRADGRLQRAAGAIRVAIVEDAVAGADGGASRCPWDPRQSPRAA